MEYYDNPQFFRAIRYLKNTIPKFTRIISIIYKILIVCVELSSDVVCFKCMSKEEYSKLPVRK